MYSFVCRFTNCHVDQLRKQIIDANGSKNSKAQCKYSPKIQYSYFKKTSENVSENSYLRK